MKTRNYRHGKNKYKAYMKPVGKGYEVGFLAGTKPLFVGNFVYSKEATAWYTKMNTEISKFAKKYWITQKSPATFYHKFISNNLYKQYYTFVERQLTQHVRKHTREFNQGVRRYGQLRKNWTPSNRVNLKRSA